MKNKYEIKDGYTIIHCPDMATFSGELKEVKIDNDKLELLSGIDSTWEICLNPNSEKEEDLLTIAAIVHGQFIEMKKVILGEQEIPKDDSDVPKSITAEEYIYYLNNARIPATEIEKGFLTPITHAATNCNWDEGVLLINGNPRDYREINMLKVKINNLTKSMALSHLENEFVYKRKVHC